MLKLTPSANPFIFGAESLIARFSGYRLPQSMLLSGPKGVGKATFAYHLARYLFQGEEETFLVDPATSLFARVAMGSHGDLKVIQRESNTAGKMARDISVESIREAVQFLQSTSFEGGWRIVIVDSVDELHFKAANALLKTLEEPPQKSLIILLAHSSGRVLPTLKSRCIRYEMLPLNDQDMDRALTHLLPQISVQERTFLIPCAEGCPGRAVNLAYLGGKEFYERFLKVLDGIASHDLCPAMSLIDQLLAHPDAEISYGAFRQFFSWWLARIVSFFSHPATEKEAEHATISALIQKHSIFFWLDFWTYATRLLRQAQESSLDRHHILTCIFYGMMVGKAEIVF